MTGSTVSYMKDLALVFLHLLWSLEFNCESQAVTFDISEALNKMKNACFFQKLPCYDIPETVDSDFRLSF